VVFSILLLFSTASGDNVTDLQSPHDQVKHNVPSEKVVCKQGLQLIDKREDNSPACVRPTTFARLLSLGWGFDPSKQWTIEGLKDTHKAGEPIIFGVKFHGFSDPCIWPVVDIKQDDKTILSSRHVILSCPPSSKSDWHYFETEWKTGLDHNHIGNLILNETGVYSVLVNGNFLQKNITIVP
jgi:hypothetical protein